MKNRDRQISVKFPKNEYEFLKHAAMMHKTTMADLLRNAWYEKQNSLSAFEHFDERIIKIENALKGCIDKDSLENYFSDNAKKQSAIYRALKELLKNNLGGK
jgi:hypothetical protein